MLHVNFQMQLFWENLGIAIFKTEFLFLPNEFHILFPSSKSAKQPIESDIYRSSLGSNFSFQPSIQKLSNSTLAIVAVEMCMMNIVIIVASSWKDKTTMTKPSSETTINYQCKRYCSMNRARKAKWNIASLKRFKNFQEYYFWSKEVILSPFTE